MGSTQDSETVDGGHDYPSRLLRRNLNLSSNHSLAHASFAIALADLMNLTENCVIEQYIKIEPTNLELGTPDAVVLIVRMTQGNFGQNQVWPDEVCLDFQV